MASHLIRKNDGETTAVIFLLWSFPAVDTKTNILVIIRVMKHDPVVYSDTRSNARVGNYFQDRQVRFEDNQFFFLLERST